MRTRTRDKYRVVYTELQRTTLEKEFEITPFINLKKKEILAKQLSLNERQVNYFIFINITSKIFIILKEQLLIDLLFTFIG